MSFRVDPALFIRGRERDRAVGSLAKYFTSFTGGKFEQFMDLSVPDEFTSRDLLAVSMLSVSVPAEVSIWLLDDGRLRVQELLSRVPVAARPWGDSSHLAPGSPGWDLWDLLRSRSGLGRTKTSKLLATKRPHLFPIYDEYVGKALLASEGDSDWIAWGERFQGDQGRELAEECAALCLDAKVRTTSALRTLDVVIWMRVHGDQHLSQVDPFWR